MAQPARTSTLLGLCAAALCAGCGNSPPPIGYFVESSEGLDHIRRVVLVDLRADEGSEQNALSMTEALGKGLQDSRVFHVDRLARTDPALRDLALDKRTTTTLEEVRDMQEQLRADAVMFGAVTQFSTHPRLQTGLFLRLLDLRRGVVVWAVDHTWDTTDKQTEARMKRFFDARMRGDYGPADWRMVRMSPLTFQKFIAHEVVATLPAPSDTRRSGP